MQRFRSRGLGATSKAILGQLCRLDIKGIGVTEVGCGVGGLLISLLSAGARTATGVDLSSRMVSAAKALAAESGFTDSASFSTGDGATFPLKQSDVVILDSVVCCYPDPALLMANTSKAATRYLVLSLPDTRLVSVKILRLLLPLQSVFVRSRACTFYLHNVETLLEQLRQKGFNLVKETRAGLIWTVLILSAP